MNRVSPYLLSLVRILAGLLFFQHGAEKLWGFAGARIDHNFAALRAYGGPIELVGGTLIALGLQTRFTAFILCGEMAVAYFKSWAPRGFFPIQNGGEEAVQFCFLYLWMVTAGAGPWSLDESLNVSSFGLMKRAAAWESHARSILRIIGAFVFSLHGFRLAFGILPALAGRRSAAGMPLDQMPQFMGYWEIVAGTLLLCGLITRPVALISSLVALGAYVHAIAGNLVWPIRGGGNETLLYAAIFLYIAATGAGRWSLDRVITVRSIDTKAESTAPGRSRT